MKKSVQTLHIFFAVLVITMTGILLPHRAHAQSTELPQITITDVNVDKFPLIRIKLYGDNLGEPLHELPIRIIEDRIEQSIISSEAISSGIQMAILIDAPRNILSPGNTGNPRMAEVSQAAGHLVKLGLLSAQTDWLAAYGSGTKVDTYDTIAEWKQDHQGVVNSIIQWQPEDRPAITSLFGIVSTAFETFESASIPTYCPRGKRI